MTSIEWFVILAFCTSHPCPVHEQFAWPMPLGTPRACTRFGVTLADIYEAPGFTCQQSIPPGVELLPGPGELWAALGG